MDNNDIIESTFAFYSIYPHFCLKENQNQGEDEKNVINVQYLWRLNLKLYSKSYFVWIHFFLSSSPFQELLYHHFASVPLHQLESTLHFSFIKNLFLSSIFPLIIQLLKHEKQKTNNIKQFCENLKKKTWIKGVRNIWFAIQQSAVLHFTAKLNSKNPFKYFTSYNWKFILNTLNFNWNIIFNKISEYQ